MKTVLAALSLLLACGLPWLACAGGGRETAPPPAPATAPAPDGSAAEDRPPAGSWWPVREGAEEAARPLSAEDRAAVDELAALGYLAGYRDAPEQSGVTVFDRERAQPGYNLVVSGHAPYAALTDLRGRVLHTWSAEPPPSYAVPPDRRFWRRVHLLDDGSLLAVFDPFGIVKLDRWSNLLWATDPSLHLHHDLFVGDDGRVTALGKRHRKIPRLHPELNFGEDMVTVLDRDGTLLDRFSILEAFARSPFAEEVEASIRRSTEHAQGPAWEDFHANAIEVLDGSQEHVSPVLAAGNVVSCSPHNNNVFIIDPDTRTVVWNWFGPWQRIHEPQIVGGGNLLLFHNNGHHQGARSQALEYDLLDRRLVWSYDGRAEDPASRFFSGTSSTVERLANGNTLIVVTESGRAIEVTPEGRVAWEFFNPERAGAERELIASLFQLQRVPREPADRWLAAVRAAAAGKP